MGASKYMMEVMNFLSLRLSYFNYNATLHTIISENINTHTYYGLIYL